MKTIKRGKLERIKTAGHIFHSPLAPVEIPDVCVTDFVLAQAKIKPQQLALIDGCTGKTLTYAQLDDKVRRLAGGLQSHGFEPGDVLALISSNCPEYAIVFYAAALCGGTISTLNPSYGIAEMRQQLKDSNAKWIVCDQNCTAVAKQAKRGTMVTQFIQIQDHPNHPCLERYYGRPLKQAPVDTRTHPVALPYSSGTTSLPKGVMLSHRNLVANIVQMNATLQDQEDEVALAVLPFFHIFGLQAVMGNRLAQGHTIVTMPRFDMKRALELIEKFSVTQFYVVPPIVLGLSQSPLVDNYKLSSLRKVLCGAAPLGVHLTNEAARRLRCEVVQGYGMTELAPVSHITPGLDSKAGTSGVTVPNTQARIVSATGGDLPPNKPGELWVKGPQVMLGYLNNRKATTDMLDADGWLRTGDIASIDEDGYLTIVDRLKELIKYKGFQIAPAELEALIITHPAVADVAVIGIPDNEAGEVPMACVVMQGGLKTRTQLEIDNTAHSIKEYVGKHLARYKRVREVQWMETIPKSASGKVLRRVIRDRYHREN